MKRINKQKIWNIVSVFMVVVLSLSTIILSVFWVREKHKEIQTPGYSERKLSMFEFENLNLAKEQIVFIGDSITDLCPLDKYYSDLSLATYNRGVGGDTTQNVLNRLKLSLFDLMPTKVVMMIGINDINSNVGEEKLLKNYEEILKQISTNLPQTEVFCMSILPMNKQIEEYSSISADKNLQIILRVNTQIEQIVEDYNYTYVNLFPYFSDSNDLLIEEYSDDGIHLNHNGFVVWSNILKPMLI